VGEGEGKNTSFVSPTLKIDQVKRIEDRLWQIELTLTSDHDKELTKVTEQLRQQTRGETGWDRLRHLLITIGNFDKAEEVYQILLKETPQNDKRKLALYYHQLGHVKHGAEDYSEALLFYYKAL
jgi:tetratricopeptide (TPR) repeat protein